MLEKLTAGWETSTVSDLKDLLEEARQSKFDFVAIPLVHPRFERDHLGVSDGRMGTLTRSDMEVDSRTWTTCVVGKVSEWLDPSSPDETVRLAAEAGMKQELAWASHLAVPAVLMPSPPRTECANYARLLNQVLSQPTMLQLWVRVSLSRPSVADDSDEEEGEGEEEEVQPTEEDGSPRSSKGRDLGRASFEKEATRAEGEFVGSACTSTCALGKAGGKRRRPGAQALPGPGLVPPGPMSPRENPWETWNRLRTLCEFKSSLGVALELTGDLPDPHVLQRWHGEPVKALVFPTAIFLTNKKGYPVLSKAHQAFVLDMYRFKIQVLLRGRNRHPGGYPVYLQYLEHLRLKLFPLPEQDRFESPYYDFLQAPLQPLMDNLESQTYETFEKDPVKYAQYEEAVAAALAVTAPTTVTVIMVVGAGRGPLVRASLAAARRAHRDVRVYAVEKNPNAVVTLRNLVAMEGWTNVTVVATDMRTWVAPEKADILVSELLGSFGDNELSPECLDGAQAFLKDGSGISIPCQYTSYLAPISSSKLWNEVHSYKDLKHMETAYVVKLHNFCQLAPAQPCFTFAHPNRAARIDNTRYTCLRFPAPMAATIHGFAGYFEAQLYKDIYISIVPQTFSTGMFSWFPLYFPLRTPAYAPEASTVEIHLWRNANERRVWYEWALTSPVTTPIHNPNGRSYWIGL
ncbi:hypothetical protein NSK_006700 [Nannochloropsis salina CCMP1776]|jgi:protein arginine N-methyltransferase 5|uniref:Protein arginine N-methyltransferase n=1 Tax=Nannochloropsis salina CCMP1776 TaxID=1027361 RepID=A0A4D9CS47_9STRA|nr:hypothetical protein NSK_006700 [Nannochloropsis salina CCMP1776]|eukprot:TFJ82032.1 hypothetical protein NSK_006700 [Nannochloropsis salina CCMP1776]